MGDSAHALQITENNMGNVLRTFLIIVRLLRIIIISMTEFCEAVAYCLEGSL